MDWFGVEIDDTLFIMVALFVAITLAFIWVKNKYRG